MKLSYKPNLQAATTIVEVVAAVTILAISAAGLMGALANGFFSVQLTRENQRATQILVERAEMARLYNWEQVTAPNFILTNFISAYDPSAANGGGTYYTGTVAVSSVPFNANYSSNMRQLTVTLDWTTRGIARQRSITTLLGKDGLQNYVY